MDTVLMHTCCAPCSLSCIDPLRSEGIEPVAFWYNPNIHPTRPGGTACWNTPLPSAWKSGYRRITA